MLKNEKYDLLMLDLMMPKKNGFEVLKDIQDLKIKVPVIVLSNLAQEEDKKKVKLFGVEVFIEKANTPIADVVSDIQKFINN